MSSGEGHHLRVVPEQRHNGHGKRGLPCEVRSADRSSERIPQRIGPSTTQRRSTQSGVILSEKRWSNPEIQYINSIYTGNLCPFTYIVVSVMASVSNWWRAELLIEMAFYLALIALVLAVIRFLVKSRPTSYRTVTVAPPVLDEWEQKSQWGGGGGTGGGNRRIMNNNY